MPSGDRPAHFWYIDASREQILPNEQFLGKGLAFKTGIEQLDRYATRLKAAQNGAITARVGNWGPC